MGLRQGEGGLLGPLEFTFLMFSMASCLPLFFLGPIGYELGLSLGQVLAAALLGNMIVAISMAVNGLPGVRDRVDFGGQARRVFGRLYKVPVLLRGLVGGMWYGVEAFNGALAMVLIILVAAGYSGEEAISLSFRLLPLALLFYVASIVLVFRRGIAAVGRAATLAGPVLLLYFAWLALQDTGTSLQAQGAPAGVPWLSTAFLAYLAVQTNWWATVAVNMSDLSRAARDWRTVWVGVLAGMVGGQLAGTLLSYQLAVQAGTGLPHEIILSQSPGTLAVLLGLAFAFLAPWTTDLSANLPALGALVKETTGLDEKKAAALAGLLGLVLAPWYLMDEAQQIVDYVAGFAASYGVLLGPILGAMIAHQLARPKTTDGTAATTAMILGIAAAYAYSIATSQITTIQLLGATIPLPSGLSWYTGTLTALIAGTLILKARTKAG